MGVFRNRRSSTLQLRRGALSALCLPGLLLLIRCAPSEPEIPAGDEASPVSAPSAAPLTPSHDWTTHLERTLHADARVFQPAPEGWHAINSAHHLQAAFGSSGIHITPSNGLESWSLDWRFVAWGRDDALLDVANVVPVLGDCGREPTVDAEGRCVRRLEYHHGPLTEWWENSSHGLEQGWTLEQPPPGQGDVVVELQGDGLAMVANDAGTGVEFEGGKLRYDGLQAWDARGESLPAWLEVEGNRIQIRVEDEGAKWPITIDPVLSASAAWTAQGAVAGDELGYSVSGAGDVNGDGFGDVVVGARGFSGNVGKAYLFLGAATGLSTTAAWTAIGESPSYFGWSVSTAGDVNGDGFGDVLVTAITWTGNIGKVYLYLGQTSGLGTTPAWTAAGEGASYFGDIATSAGDVNGDGFSDVIVGASQYSGMLGKVYVYHGAPSGLSTTPSWTFTGEPTGSAYGYSAASAGDVNGDGFSDVIVGAYAFSSNAGKAYIYLGSAAGLGSVAVWGVAGSAGERVGICVASAGDVNADGYGDVVVGASAFSSNTGKARLYLGGSSGPDTTADWTTQGEAAGSYYGWSVSGAGDVNGDGFADVIVGAYGDSTSTGKAYLFLGASLSLKNTASWTATGSAVNSSFGFQVSAAGDVNSDGFGDVIVGSHGSTSAAGQALVYHGSGGILYTSPINTGVGSAANNFYGRSIALVGDVNGDGYSDAIVGAPGYSSNTGRAYFYLGNSAGSISFANTVLTGLAANDTFGSAVGPAGDVNGDGYADVIVGAPAEAGNAGKVYVYRGSSTGLVTPALWTMQGEATNNRFGSAVGSGEDVNGDGYSDVIVGAPGYASNYGRAYVYPGSASGPALTPTWVKTGDLAGDIFGTVLGSAGDVNGDGYSDVVVGAPGRASQTGIGYVFAGSSTGLSTTPLWAVTGTSASFFARSVASAGDVNGDGYDDVLVGAPGFNSYAGQAYLYLGASTGLNTTPTWQTQGGIAMNHFGFALGSPGDVNGDGYSDFIIGQYGSSTERGAAYLYLGAPSSISLSSAWSAVGEGSTHRFGYTVSSAGDYNGDGFGDVLIGADKFATSTGKVYHYPGNADMNTSPGHAARAQARRADSSAPLTPGSRSDSPDGFNVKVHTGRSLYGRLPLRLQVEAKKRGTPFNGQGLQTSPSYTDSLTSAVPLELTLTGLDPDSDYHWRARIQYAPARGTRQGWSRWLPGGISGQRLGVHVHTNCALIFYADADGDGVGDSAQDLTACSSPSGYVTTGGDCDDQAPSVFPGGTEVCNGIDDDCDGLPDEGVGSTFYADADGDGFGDSNNTVTACLAPTGYTPIGGDCNDGETIINPQAPEACDTIDTNCDGIVDEVTSDFTFASGIPVAGSVRLNDITTTLGTEHMERFEATSIRNDGSSVEGTVEFTFDSPVNSFYLDVSRVGIYEYLRDFNVGAPTLLTGDLIQSGADVMTTNLNDQGQGRLVWTGLNTTVITFRVGPPFTALAIDRFGFGVSRRTFYADVDGDSYGDGNSPQLACSQPLGTATRTGDCDDQVSSTNPDASESCNGVDDNCNTVTDEGVQSTFYADGDGDGHGSATSPQSACSAPSGFTSSSDDCDDLNVATYPGAAELCNGRDEDCDTVLDNNAPDTDGDGACDDLDPCPASPNDDSDGDGTCDDVDPCPASPNDDSDGDGACDDVDPCPASPNDDSDGDGACDDVDPCPASPLGDSDGDGACDNVDPCPASPNDDSDGDGACDNVDPCPASPNDDSDGDGACDNADPCPASPNGDSDGDGACDDVDPCPASPNDDSDGDGACDDVDPCPASPNGDSDGDGACDDADPCPASPLDDTDGDGACDDVDPCPASPLNDSDGDGACDDADPCPASPLDDSDGDGACDDVDPCPASPSDDSDGDSVCDDVDRCPGGIDAADSDFDGIPDACDNCPALSNSTQDDTDGDGFGNPCDGNDDTDQDGIRDNEDNCPLDRNADQSDTDSDGEGDECDLDDDNDGVEDDLDALPEDGDETIDTDGDGTGDNADPNDDGDGADDTTDAFPLDPNETTDTDDDTLGNNADPDDDEDGVLDEADNCPLDANADQLDSDGDGLGEVCDAYPQMQDWQVGSGAFACRCSAGPSTPPSTGVGTLLVLVGSLVGMRRKRRPPTPSGL